MYHKLGTEVTRGRVHGRVLPGMEKDCARRWSTLKKKRNVNVHLETKAKGSRRRRTGSHVEVKVDGKSTTFECDVVLSMVGRRPNGNLGLEAIGVKIDRRASSSPSTARCRPTVPGIYAIGDVAGQPMLAHKGSTKASSPPKSSPATRAPRLEACVPAVIFTDPEIGSVGLSEDDWPRRASSLVGKFPFGASGRALSLNEPTASKVVADAKTDKLLGVHMIGPEVTELIAEAGLAIEMGATLEDLALTIHAHPTLPEAIMEAAESVHDHGRAHLPKSGAVRH
jgi:dihydrolipoamide dehydrogenase